MTARDTYKTTGVTIAPRVAPSLGVAALAVMVATQLASARLGQVPAVTSVVVAALAAASVCFASWQRHVGVVALAATGVVSAALAAEWIGTATGWPFGAYHYTGLLQPTIGPVPVVVLGAWLGLALPAYAVGAYCVRGRPARIAVGAVALTAWDLFLDPQMLRAGYWVWDQAGVYRGVPLTNFAGWLLVSVIAMIVLDVALGPDVRNAGLLAVYTVMAVMETVAFAFVFESDYLVASLGAVAMGAPAALAWVRRSRRG